MSLYSIIRLSMLVRMHVYRCCVHSMWEHLLYWWTWLTCHLQVEVRVQHDPSRLYQLTTGWEERLKPTSTQDTADVFTSARDVPRR